jgi:hypothetical protein
LHFRKLIFVTAALAAAVFVFGILSLPPASLSLANHFSDGTVPGIIHVHTSRSDGRGTATEVAAVGARAGLKFVVFTDHGDATTTPDPPVYRSGVLCLDAVEISTQGGHYLALDMPAAPYPLGGDPRDVVEDVKRLGGFGIVAHPESPKPALMWQAWDAPFDGIEWINPDTSWRVRLQGGWSSRWSMLAALATYPIRPAETMARLLGGTALHVDRWQAVALTRRVVILAGADAHANLAFGNGDPIDNRFSLPLPGYEASFRTMSVHASLEGSLTGNPTTDAGMVMRALRAGRAYVAIDGLATPPSFEFSATGGDETVGQGDGLVRTGPVTLRVKSNAPPSYTTVVWHSDKLLASFNGKTEISQTVDRPGVYRIEITAPSKYGPSPWLISNPIYVGLPHPASPSRPEPPIAAKQMLFDGRTAAGWWTEADSGSTAALAVDSTGGVAALRLHYDLSKEPSPGPYATVSVNTPTGEPFRRVTFSVRSDRAIRLGVQLRMPGPGGDRWERSVYADATNRHYSIDFDDMTPIDVTRSARPAMDAVRDLMFVIDTTHAKPGSSGDLWLEDVVLTR